MCFSFCLLSNILENLNLNRSITGRLTLAITVGKGKQQKQISSVVYPASNTRMQIFLLLLIENFVKFEIMETNSNLTSADCLFKCPISESRFHLVLYIFNAIDLQGSLCQKKMSQQKATHLDILVPMTALVQLRIKSA